MSMARSLEERFWEKVDVRGPNNCWQWMAGKDRDGYGRIRLDGNGPTLRAHRVSFEIAHGPIPDGLQVLHTCDNPGCCNPAHLFLGTDADNHHDMDQKGRRVNPLGEAHGMSKLTEGDVLTIRELSAAGYAQEAIARKFGIGHSTVSDVVNRKSWKHI